MEMILGRWRVRGNLCLRGQSARRRFLAQAIDFPIDQPHELDSLFELRMKLLDLHGGVADLFLEVVEVFAVAVEPLDDGVEPSIVSIEPLDDRLELGVMIYEPAVDAIESLVDLRKPVSRFGAKVVHAPAEFGEPPVDTAFEIRETVSEVGKPIAHVFDASVGDCEAVVQSRKTPFEIREPLSNLREFLIQ